MNKIEVEIPEGKKAEWVNGVLTLVDDKPIEYKFNVGDKVMVTAPNSYPQDAIYEIVELKERDGEPLYEMKCKDGTYKAYERYLKLVPQDITERIKTFEDAYQWCVENGEANLVNHYDDWEIYNDTSKDIIAYLKLRIITCALNEGWEPNEGEACYTSYIYDGCGYITELDRNYCDSSNKLRFKSGELALYAAAQFRDIYADFCGIKKGGGE